ncbi:ITFG1 isoform 12, partial [Pan troglodytes]
MDVLLTYLPKNYAKSELGAVIFWGQNQTLDTNNMTILNRTFQDEPLIMDFNGDLIPDIFGITNESNQPQILLGG